MKVSIDVEQTDLRKIIGKLNGIEESIEEGLRQAMLFVEWEAKKSFGKVGHLKSRSGRLRSSIKAEVKGLKGSVGTNVIYGPTHEFGATIKPKKGEYLRFQIMGQWKTVKQVVIPPRPFIGPALEENKEDIIGMILDKITEDFYR